MVAGCRWWRRGGRRLLLRLEIGGVKLGKGLGFCAFLLGCCRMKTVFLIVFFF